LNSKKSDETGAAMHHPGAHGQAVRSRGRCESLEEEWAARRRGAVCATVVADVGSCASWRSPVDFFYAVPAQPCVRQEIGFMNVDYWQKMRSAYIYGC
jgi:hypothetical protein